MGTRSIVLQATAALLIFAGTAHAEECLNPGPGFKQMPFTAMITVSGPMLSATPCGQVDCATAIVEGVTGHKIDAKTAQDFAQPTTTYLRWTGSHLMMGDGAQWHDIPVPPALIGGANPAASGITVSCHSGGEAVMNGQAATLYITHVQGKGVTVDATTWLAKANGLPIKTVQQIKGGRMSVTTYDYAASP